MKQVLEQLIHLLVDHPGDVLISELQGEKTIIYELRCNKGDVGKIIGKSGKTVASLRSILNTIAARSGKRAMLEVVE